jgi:hypothetical protein
MLPFNRKLVWQTGRDQPVPDRCREILFAPPISK